MYKKIFEETLPKMMKSLEAFLGDGWLVGNKLSIADFYIGGYYTNIITHEPNACPKEVKDKFKMDYPKFTAYGERFAKEV